ncbi:MAG TPA: transglutaminase-like domain-containing protein [Candidatus Margulisiibacteriota bacterium]|nr:transglutaminase-like domain-containing protein [Candidatus Margulisiibacteriota bacterium]
MAMDREKVFDKLNAYRYYKKTLEAAEPAFPGLDKNEQLELSTIIEQSHKRMDELLEESRTIGNLKSCNLRTPELISQWMQNNIAYKSDWALHGVMEYWQTPQETLTLKAGDCEDAAFLIQALLDEIGISSTVISVGYIDEAGAEKRHAMCIFPADEPRAYFNNAYLFKTNEAVDASFIMKLYPGCYDIDILDLYNKSRIHLFKKR